jgi:hypothetical protein
MPRLVAYCVLLLGLIVPMAASADGPYLSDLPRLFPTAYANWGKSLPYAISLGDWLTKFDGVVSPCAM